MYSSKRQDSEHDHVSFVSCLVWMSQYQCVYIPQSTSHDPLYIVWPIYNMFATVVIVVSWFVPLSHDVHGVLLFQRYTPQELRRTAPLHMRLCATYPSLRYSPPQCHDRTWSAAGKGLCTDDYYDIYVDGVAWWQRDYRQLERCCCWYYCFLHRDGCSQGPLAWAHDDQPFSTLRFVL